MTSPNNAAVSSTSNQEINLVEELENKLLERHAEATNQIQSLLDVSNAIILKNERIKHLEILNESYSAKIELLESAYKLERDGKIQTEGKLTKLENAVKPVNGAIEKFIADYTKKLNCSVAPVNTNRTELGGTLQGNFATFSKIYCENFGVKEKLQLVQLQLEKAKERCNKLQSTANIANTSAAEMKTEMQQVMMEKCKMEFQLIREQTKRREAEEELRKMEAMVKGLYVQIRNTIRDNN